MRKVGLVIVFTVALVALVFARAGFSRESVTTLKGSVGPGYTISLTKSGHRVKSLPAGTYRITIRDRSPIHDFTLEKGTKPEKHLTTVGFSGTKTVTVKLTKGRWEYFCSVHEPYMNHTLVVK